MLHIGQSAIRHHFVAEQAAAETVGGTEDVAEEKSEGRTESWEEIETVGVETPPTENMNSIRDHCMETDRLKRVLGFANRQRNFSIGNAVDDDGLDFTPVKVSEMFYFFSGISFKLVCPFR